MKPNDVASGCPIQMIQPKTGTAAAVAARMVRLVFLASGTLGRAAIPAVAHAMPRIIEARVPVLFMAWILGLSEELLHRTSAY
jgi:hypothetical protein